jgi:FdhE protein
VDFTTKVTIERQIYVQMNGNDENLSGLYTKMRIAKRKRPMNPADIDIKHYSQTMPQYRESLVVLQSVLDFQTALAEKVPDLRVESAVAHERWQAGQPLFANESLPIPPSLFREALEDLHPLLPEGPARVALDQLLASSLMEPMNVESLLDDLMTDSDSCLERLADATSVESDTLAFLLRIVLSPFFEKQTRLYRSWLEATTWRSGLCPMCGSEPAMARLAHDDGRRILACSLCRTEWVFDRLRCPFCENGEQAVGIPEDDKTQPRLRYFTVADDETHRVDCCDRCQRYLKTVDERVSGRPANLWIEEVITAHLDVLAGEQGYH